MRPIPTDRPALTAGRLGLLRLLALPLSLVSDRPGLLIIGDKAGAQLLRPSYRNRAPRPGEQYLKRSASSSLP
ncbi:hypothetical protein SMD20_19320 [Nonomuraea sp. LP-02]|nr:hypothetical protein [Nonomuraea sp. LP-02]MED7926414.1 hypothetical protein [Nonomuraea sp. LP-02]